MSEVHQTQIMNYYTQIIELRTYNKNAEHVEKQKRTKEEQLRDVCCEFVLLYKQIRDKLFDCAYLLLVLPFFLI